jgi:hypothetical protein
LEFVQPVHRVVCCVKDVLQREKHRVIPAFCPDVIQKFLIPTKLADVLAKLQVVHVVNHLPMPVLIKPSSAFPIPQHHAIPAHSNLPSM